jgi:hypothetical protein
MIIRCFWRNCDYRGKEWGSKPIDAFWVEAIKEEAEVGISPWLKPAQIAESIKLAETYKGLAKMMGQPDRPFCFLIARDLSSIDPFHVSYPIDNLWNAYSPFERMDETRSISRLEEIRNLALPAGNNTSYSDAS